MAYRADIEIAVRGARELKALQNQLLATSESVSVLDGNLRAVANQLPRSISNLRNVVAQAARSFEDVALNTNEAVDAARDYVKATDELNRGLQERLQLVRNIRAAETAAQRRIAPGDAGYGQQMPALPPGMVRAQEVQQSWNKFFRDAAETAVDIQQTSAASKLNIKKSWNTFFQDAADLATDLTAQIRATEAAASRAARGGDPAAFSAGGVIRRPIAGPAYTEPAGPGGAGVTSASAVAAEASLRRTLDLQIKNSQAAVSWGVALQAGNRWLTEDLNVTKALLDTNNKILSSTYAQEAARKRLSKIKAFETTQQQQATRTQQLNESIALGVGFPLLFGGGAGSILGSFAGSFAGKGFGGQIIGGALGQAIDNFVVGIADITKSLDNIVQAAGIAGTTTETYIEALKSQNREQEATAVATEALARIVGDQGVKALQDFEDAGTKLANAFTQLGTQLAALAAQVAGPTLQGISTAVEESVLIRQAERSQDPRQVADIQRRGQAFGSEYYEIQQRILERQREINAAIDNEQTGLQFNLQLRSAASQEARSSLELSALDLAISKEGGEISNAKVQSLMLQRIELEYAAKQQQLITSLTEDQADFLQITTKLQGLQNEYNKARYDLQNRINTVESKSAEQAQREADRLRKRLASLNAEISQKTIVLDIDRKIADAEAANLDDKVKELQIDRAMAESAGRAAGIRTQELDKAEEKKRLKLEELRLEEQLLQITTRYAEERRRVEESFDTALENIVLELRLAEAVTNEEERRLKLEQKRLALKGEGFDDTQISRIVELNQELLNLQTPLQQYLITTQRWLNDTQTQVVSLAQSIQTSISGAMTTAVSSLVTGAQTTQQILADMFGQIGRAFVAMATEIITKQIVMITLQSILKALGAVGGGAEPRTDAGNAAFMQRTAGLDLAGSAYNPSAPIPKFATGGYVTGPTNALIGEGGESEYIIPASKMAGAMARYSAGARGSNVIPDSSAPSAGGPGGSNTFTLETVVINNVEYATVEQVRELSARAARDGAEGGYTRSMSALRNSRSQRSRIGLR